MTSSDDPGTTSGDRPERAGGPGAAPATPDAPGRAATDGPGTGPAATAGAPRVRTLAAAATGIVAVLAYLAVAEVAAVVTGPEGSPLPAVGQVVVDLAPAPVKDVTIAVFGTADKLALGVLLGLGLLAVAGAAGVLQQRRPPTGSVVVGAGGLLALAAVLTRAGAEGSDGVPGALGTVVGLLVLAALATRLRRWRAVDAPPGPEPSSATGRPVLEGRTTGPHEDGARVARRTFLTWVGVTGAVALAAGTAARTVTTAARAVGDLRQQLALPTAARPAAAVPTGASLDVAGITPYVTPAADFYRIDTALQVPAVDPTTWRLRVHGLVDREVELTYEDLLALPLVEHHATLSCVSNEVGGELVGTALWLGWPIREVLARAGVRDGADMVLSTSVDGFTAGTPLDVLQDDGVEALLAVGMNGEPLPLEHGFPVRMVVPGLYGYVSATKWLTSLEVTRFADAEGYWTPRGWSERGPVKLQSRIDVPRGRDSVPAGTVAVAGVAWQPHVGVSRVEVRVDGGPWQRAELADSTSADTWRQWVLRWDATPGRHELTVRATGADGVVQPEARRAPAPDGAEGWHTVVVDVA